ncbi:MAG: hypothetical protein HY332_05675 [Chloroflexi bacterium]|nr:hypothetical protein [Chloroflexota bacterium]
MSTVSYELWDIESGNLVGGYETEEAALSVVRRCVVSQGRGAAETLGLARESRGRTKTIAVGAALVDLALATAPLESPEPIDTRGRAASTDTDAERTSIVA